MTERQGGSDVRANTTRAEPVGGDGVRAHGAKWFCSAPMSRRLPRARAGARRADLLPAAERGDGLREHPAAEGQARRPLERVAARSSFAARGRGSSARRAAACRRSSRWSSTRGSTASSARRRGCAQAVEQATWHARAPLGIRRLLADQPLMRNVLADLCVESEAATADGAAARARLRPARDDEREAAFARIATAIAKYWVCKRGPAHAAEALECLGGNGYVEESGMPRLYREQPLLSIWEGSGNVVALDVLRALQREPETLEAFLDELEPGDLAPTRGAVGDGGRGERPQLVERLALGLQASLLAATATGRGRERSSRGSGSAYGTLPAGIDTAAIVERHRPAV